MDSNPPLPDELAPPRQRLDIVATRHWHEKPERWSATITIDGRTIDLGTFSSIGKALYTGAQVYYASTVPPHLRRKRQKLLE